MSEIHKQNNGNSEKHQQGQIKKLSEHQEEQLRTGTAQVQKQIETIQIGDACNQLQEERFLQSNPNQAMQLKKQANSKYSQKQYQQALKLYRNALQFLDASNQVQKKDKSIVYSNIGLTYMKMEMQQTAVEYFKKSLKLNQNYLKARTNLGQCYQLHQKPEEALQQYKKVYEASPQDQFIKQKIASLQIKVNQLNQKRKEEVLGGLKNIGNSILGYFGMSLDNFKLQQGTGGGYNVSFKK